MQKPKEETHRARSGRVLNASFHVLSTQSQNTSPSEHSDVIIDHECSPELPVLVDMGFHYIGMFGEPVLTWLDSISSTPPLPEVGEGWADMISQSPNPLITWLLFLMRPVSSYPKTKKWLAPPCHPFIYI